MTAPKHFIAFLDTGGISHSGREIYGLGATADEAKAAVVKRFFRGRKSVEVSRFGDIASTPAEVEEWFGIRVVGPLADAQAVEGNW